MKTELLGRLLLAMIFLLGAMLACDSSTDEDQGVRTLVVSTSEEDTESKESSPSP